MYIRTFMIVAAAALAVLPKSDAEFERQQLGSNLRLSKEHAGAAPGFTTEPSCACDEMKEIITSQKDEIDSLKALVHQMGDELADQRRKLHEFPYDPNALPCVPSAMPSESPSSEPSTQPSSQPSSLPSSLFADGQVPQCDTGGSGRLLWLHRSLQSEACLCGECIGIECDFTGHGPKAVAYCITPTDGCQDKLKVNFKPSGKGTCRDTFEFGVDKLCPRGWLVKRPSGCKNTNPPNILELSSADAKSTTCLGDAEIHTSCSCTIEMCDKYGKYQISGYQLVDTDELTVPTSGKCRDEGRTCTGICNGNPALTCN